MEKNIRKCLSKIKPYVPGKPIEEVERELGIKNVIKMASNENPLGPSPMGVQALKEAAGSVQMYPDGNCYYLKKKLAGIHSLKEENFIVGNGSDEVLKFIAEALLEEGDETIMADPSFSEYDFVTKLMGGQLVTVPTKEFTHDLAEMAKKITPRTRIVFICNPNNPTGTMNTKAEVDSFMEKVPDDVLVVFDEAYFEYVENPEYPDTLEYVRADKNVIVLRTFSKAYGLAGLRVGYGVAPAKVIAGLNLVREPFNVNLLAQKAALAALDDDAFVTKSNQVNNDGKKYLYHAFEEMNLDYVPTVSNFIFVDVKKDSKEVFNSLLLRGVIVRTGDIFGYPTFIRVTISKNEENERFIKELKEVLADQV